MTQWTCTKVALVDDDEALRHAITQILRLNDLIVLPFSSAEAAIAEIGADFSGVVLTDVRMPGMDGIELQRRLWEKNSELPVILLTGHGDIPTAVAALQRGAYDFLTKPFVPENLITSVKRALEKRTMQLELQALRDRGQAATHASQLIGETPIMTQLMRTIGQVAELDIDILIEGETGVGKSLVADLLHAQSNRSRRPLISVDCGGLSEEQAEVELFGSSSRLQAQGNTLRSPGKLERADRGTLFLDCFESLAPIIQQKLEPRLEARARVGQALKAVHGPDIRVIAASKVTLMDLVAAGRFSASLYYRVTGITLHIPPLRDRQDDIPILFSAFLKQACERAGRDIPKLTPSVWRRLKGHDWPGNVRELMRYSEQVALNLGDLNEAAIATSHYRDKQSLKDRVASYEAALIEETLRATLGHVPSALDQLDLPRKTFYDKINRYQIDLSSFKK